MVFSKRSHIWIGIFFSVSLGVLLFAGAFRTWQDKFLDFMFTRSNAPSNIVIVEIDDQSIIQIGQWPWPRALFGQIIQKLQQAAVIGIDINFKESSRLGNADDQILANTLATTPSSVVLSSELKNNGDITLPIEIFTKNSSQGFTNIVISPDGVARKVNYSSVGRLNFASKITQNYLKENFSQLVIPNVTTRIFYNGPDRTYVRYTVKQLLDDKVPDSAFTGKIVLLGATARDLQDYHQTAFGLTSGVEIQANIVNTLLGQKFFFESKLLTLLLIILFSFWGAILSMKFKNFVFLLTAAILTLIIYNVIALLAFDRLVILDLLYPNVAFILSWVVSLGFQYLTTSREKRFIQDSFSRYLSPHVIQELIRNPSQLTLGGRSVNLTILFSDIRSFTSISETMTPQQITQFLNDYLGKMTDVVLDHNGVIDKYIGDAIMAFWGAPLPNENHILDGVLAALEMLDRLAAFNSEHADHGDNYPHINIGIGINSGEVTVGNMGSEKRFDYTVIGDNVNLASRLESLTKVYGVNLLISDLTKEGLTEKAIAEHNLLIREIDRVLVKGKKKAVRIYEILPNNQRENFSAVADVFANAMENYYRGEWDMAIEKFEAVLKSKPNDGPSLALRDRCQGLKHRQDLNWEGIFEHKEK